MSFVVSARKYRPSRFDEVVGQNHVSQTLKNALQNEKVAHAFLFCGPRGVGKTTCARILAKVLNCESPTADMEACDKCSSCNSFNESASFNIHELDAASNNSVDHIRALTDQVRFQPQQGKYKVYIIDEVHMLSQSAFNAFLKTLEEPPPYAIFILATTEKHKIIPTILSRCQIFDFKRIGIPDIVGHLEYICKEEGIEADKDALHIIAEKADGALRDGLSIFDRIVSYADKEISYDDVISNLNILDYDYYFKVTDHLMTENLSSLMLVFNEINVKGFEPDIFINGLANHFRNLLVCQDPLTLTLLEVGDQIKERYAVQAKLSSPSLLVSALSLVNDCDVNYKMARNKRLHVEMCLIKMCYINRALGFSQLPKQEQITEKAATAEKKSPELKDVTLENNAAAFSKENLSIQPVIAVPAEEKQPEKIEAPSEEKPSLVQDFEVEPVTSESLNKPVQEESIKTKSNLNESDSNEGVKSEIEDAPENLETDESEKVNSENVVSNSKELETNPDELENQPQNIITHEVNEIVPIAETNKEEIQPEEVETNPDESANLPQNFITHEVNEIEPIAETNKEEIQPEEVETNPDESANLPQNFITHEVNKIEPIAETNKEEIQPEEVETNPDELENQPQNIITHEVNEIEPIAETNKEEIQPEEVEIDSEVGNEVLESEEVTYGSGNSDSNGLSGLKKEFQSNGSLMMDSVSVTSLKSVEQAVKAEVKTDIPADSFDFTQEELNLAWENYCSQIHSKSAKGYFISAEVLKGEEEITIKIGSQVAEGAIRNDIGLIPFLETTLQILSPKLSFIIDKSKMIEEPAESKKPLNDKEKYQILREKNPLLDKLQKKFDLRLDI